MFENGLFLGNNLNTYFIAVVILLCSLAILHAFKFIIITKAKRFAKHTKTDIDDLLVDMFDTFNWFYFISLSIYLSLKWFSLDFGFEKALNYVMFLLTLFFVIKALLKVVDYVARKLSRKNDGESNAIINFLASLVKGVLWLFAILFILSNLGVNVTSAMAGLGIGGIAIALALQNILGDLFSSVSIYFDKPFKIDDFIIVGEHMGVVKNIGIKTTRIESLWGEEIVISNSELTSTRIRNFKKMEKRRIHMSFGVVYQTTPEKLKKINLMIKDIFKKIELATLDRVHFKQFGQSSLEFEIAYYVNTGDYNKYMDVQQDINYAIFEKFKKEKIEFAYPTRTIFMHK